jgi:hypothetical protein
MDNLKKIAVVSGIGAAATWIVLALLYSEDTVYQLGLAVIVGVTVGIGYYYFGRRFR